MNFTILGHVSARVGRDDVPLDGRKQRTVLAALLLADSRVLSDERLTTLLWGHDPPVSSQRQLYTYVSRLRTRLGPGHGLERVGAGYRMDIDGVHFDWEDFRNRSREADGHLEAGRYAEAERLLAAALALWCGPALQGVTEELAGAERLRLEEARLAALERHIEALLALDRLTEAVQTLTREVARHPLRERLRGQLMTALYRCGRQADALAAYDEAARTLAEELGLDPSPELRGLRQAVLRGELAPVQALSPAPAVPSPSIASGTPAPNEAARGAAPGGTIPAPWTTPGPGVVPALLPPAPADFTGREAETDTLRDILSGGLDAVIAGAPGTGTSALTLSTAGSCRAAFPDGQLYADLRAAPDGTARAPHEVLGAFLRALGVHPRAQPASLEERVQLYRTLLAGRQLLVVLDNVANDMQVRPLLPGPGESRTLICGARPALASLEGVRLVQLGPLRPREAVRLLVAVVGRARLARDPEAAVRIAELCDRLPLALRIAGTRLAVRPGWSTARLLDRLAPEERRLHELRFGSLDVRAALWRAWQQLTPIAAEAFTALGGAGLPVLTAADTAALLGVPPVVAEEALEQLADAGLLEERLLSHQGPPRYCFRSLPLLFAREMAADCAVDRRLELPREPA